MDMIQFFSCFEIKKGGIFYPREPVSEILAFIYSDILKRKIIGFLQHFVINTSRFECINVHINLKIGPVSERYIKLLRRKGRDNFMS